MAVSEVAGLEMHGTGTPLGDPIEVGAAAAALHSPGRSLQLSAAKSIVGHAEPAAGLAGMSQAVSILLQAQIGFMPHVRTPNPHVASLFDDSSKKAQVVVPRQAGGRVAVNGAAGVGISAFAFQGTNAHAVIQPSNQTPLLPTPPSTWRRERHWYAVRSTASLHKAVCTRDEGVRFQTKVTRTALAFLMDHQVQGLALFPGSGMFDAACSACNALSGDHGSKRLALLNASIAAPMPLEAISEKVFTCHVKLALARVEIQSQTGQTAYQSHLRATFGE